MRPIPLNLMTLYADLMQNVGTLSAPAGSIATKTIRKKKYLYVTTKDGSSRIERYFGPANDPLVIEQAEKIKKAAAQAKSQRNTVSLLKKARIAAPTLVQGRILEVLSNAGLFERGMTLVGTVAYQTYPCIIGAHLGAASYATNDIDISLAEFVAGNDEEDIESILKRADPSFSPIWQRNDKLPRSFKSKSFQVDILTSHKRGRESPIPIKELGCAADALTFQEYPVGDTMEVVALYGSGVLVRVPSPTRFAIHKLLVAQRRKKSQLAKKQKDLRQAQELIDVFLETDPDLLQDTLDDARDRGRAWKTTINASLKELGRDARQGHLPLPVTPKKKTTKRKATAKKPRKQKAKRTKKAAKT